MWIMPYNQFGHHKGMSPSNFVVKVEPEKCKACGLCTKRCPMDALQLKFSTKATNKYRKAVVIDRDVCIGCGVCVHKCKPKAIMMERREPNPNSPKNMVDWAMKHMVDLHAAREKNEAR